MRFELWFRAGGRLDTARQLLPLRQWNREQFENTGILILEFRVIPVV